MSPADPDEEGRGPRVSRRVFLGAAGAAGLVGATGGVALGTSLHGTDAPAPTPERIPFHGANQAGIATAFQHNLNFAAFDVTTEDSGELRDLLRAWTYAASRLCSGLPVGPVEGPPAAPPVDTGEAVGLPPSRLTVTFGFGPTLFERHGVDRFGLRRLRPEPLVDIPPMPGDALDPSRSGGDIGVQACADEPQVAFHVVRTLARMGRRVVAMRWSQVGFGRTSSAGHHDPTPRNLQGFKDGTNNIGIGDQALLARDVWVGAADSPAWMRGGTYQVVRRIRMFIETWDRSALREQQETIGRHKLSGAPLGGAQEFDAVNLNALGSDGKPVIPLDAHIRLAGPTVNEGVRILRRGYSFTEGIDARTGELDAGLFFVCFQRDPRRQFIPIQQRLASTDALNEYIMHEGSAIFAIPPGVATGHFVGEALFGSV
jgi:deferrochelatase/peroxidase EfeB